MNIYSKLQESRAEILAIAAKHGADNVRIFGSVARHEADSASDLDLLMDLQELLGCRVDVVTEKGLSRTVSGSGSSKRLRRYEKYLGPWTLIWSGRR